MFHPFAFGLANVLYVCLPSLRNKKHSHTELGHTHPHTNSHPTRPNFQSPGHFSLSPVSWKVTGSARPQEKSSCLWRRPTQARTFSFKPGGSPGAVTRDSQLQEPHPGTLAMARGVCAPLQSQALHLSSSSASPPPVKKKSDFHRCLSPD